MCDHPDREAAMTVISSCVDGIPTVWCDPCLAPLVKALNDAGLPTVASCCGHGRRPSTVALADGREVLLIDSAEARRLNDLWPDINAAVQPECADCGGSGKKCVLHGEAVVDSCAPCPTCSAIDQPLGDSDGV